jgi:hypothetical protein
MYYPGLCARDALADIFGIMQILESANCFKAKGVPAAELNTAIMFIILLLINIRC